MKRVEIYTKNYCPYCHRAKNLLQNKNMAFIEYDVTDDPAREEEMRRRAGRQTVPAIFIEDSLIGGCDDLFAMEAAGTLNEHLGI